jgi:hypothetical protein
MRSPGRIIFEFADGPADPAQQGFLKIHRDGVAAAEKDEKGVNALRGLIIPFAPARGL